MNSLIWATRGRAWGNRFLLDGGLADPLSTYEGAFAGTDGRRTAFRRAGEIVALRFPDPEGRKDDAGRPISHEVVALPPASDGLTSTAKARDAVWPLLAAAFTELWLLPQAPTDAEIRAALEHGGGDEQRT